MPQRIILVVGARGVFAIKYVVMSYVFAVPMGSLQSHMGFINFYLFFLCLDSTSKDHSILIGILGHLAVKKSNQYSEVAMRSNCFAFCWSSG